MFEFLNTIHLRSFSNKVSHTLIGNLVSTGPAGDLSRFTTPKI